MVRWRAKLGVVAQFIMEDYNSLLVAKKLKITLIIYQRASKKLYKKLLSDKLNR